MDKQTIKALIGLAVLLACWVGAAISDSETELSNQSKGTLSLSSRLINK